MKYIPPILMNFKAQSLYCNGGSIAALGLDPGAGYSVCGDGLNIAEVSHPSCSPGTDNNNIYRFCFEGNGYEMSPPCGFGGDARVCCNPGGGVDV